MAFERIWL